MRDSAEARRPADVGDCATTGAPTHDQPLAPGNSCQDSPSQARGTLGLSSETVPAPTIKVIFPVPQHRPQHTTTCPPSLTYSSRLSRPQARPHERRQRFTAAHQSPPAAASRSATNRRPAADPLCHQAPLTNPSASPVRPAPRPGSRPRRRPATAAALARPRAPTHCRRAPPRRHGPPDRARRPPRREAARSRP